MPIDKKLLKSIARHALRSVGGQFAKGGTFEALGANAFESNRHRRIGAEALAYADECRMDQLRNRTKAEIRMAEELDQHRIFYENEKIFLNGDRHILADFYIPSAMLTIEVDGSVHDDSKRCGAGRVRWLSERYGVRAVRI